MGLTWCFFDRLPLSNAPGWGAQKGKEEVEAALGRAACSLATVGEDRRLCAPTRVAARSLDQSLTHSLAPIRPRPLARSLSRTLPRSVSSPFTASLPRPVDSLPVHQFQPPCLPPTRTHPIDHSLTHPRSYKLTRSRSHARQHSLAHGHCLLPCPPRMTDESGTDRESRPSRRVRGPSLSAAHQPACRSSPRRNPAPTPQSTPLPPPTRNMYKRRG